MDHDRTRQISGFYLVLFLSSEVVEADIPWKDSQVSEYGPLFAAWEEKDYSNMLGSLSGALQLNNYAMVVGS